MGSITEGTVLRVVASLLFPDDVIAQNVFHLVATTVVDGDPENVVTDMTEYLDAIYAHVDGQMQQDMASDEMKVYEYDSVDEDFDEVGTGTFTLVPQLNTGLLPHGVAVLQNFYTLDPDVQGRKFWPGADEFMLNDAEWSPAAIADFVLAAVDVVTQLVAAETGNTYTPVVWSPTRGNAYAYSGVVNTPTVPAYQRRRKPGVGI
jgi:hypothetical protein